MNESIGDAARSLRHPHTEGWESMRRVAIAFVALLLMASTALAGNAHFVGTPTATRDGDNLIVSGKIAGLGNETQVHVVVTADAECINPGSKKPQAGNKESFSAEGQFPVQNGKANYALELVATLSPNCTPPMTLRWSDVLIEDLTHPPLSQFYPGPF